MKENVPSSQKEDVVNTGNALWWREHLDMTGSDPQFLLPAVPVQTVPPLRVSRSL